jgi:2,4-dienoyl-CoA reductase [(3E)-enoyl-CoA-producing], mitochondrial
MNQALKTILLPANYYLGKNILITGGGSGLGKQMATHYAQLGGKVTILGRNEKKLKETSQEIISKTNNSNISYESLDVKNYTCVLRLANNLEQQGKIPDIVINNAAGNFICPSEKLTPNGWNSIIDTVLKGTVNMTLEFGKKMINLKKPGVFLNISTTYAETGSGYVVPSSIAKAGCNNLTKSLGAEWGKYGIRTLSIAPGPIYTEGAFSRLDPTNQFTEIARKKLPLKRLGEKEELANLATFLTSDHNSWMTGQVINLDGGEVVGNSGEFNMLEILGEDDWKRMSKM